MKHLLTVAAAAILALVVFDARAQTYEPYPIALLGGMDKVTGNVTRFEVAVGETAAFGSLEVTARACRKTPPEETPESASFLQIDDTTLQDRVFSGWMFASSPGVSALEHPVYDVWVLDCLAASQESSSSE
jgi:hypothetical protein